MKRLIAICCLVFPTLADAAGSVPAFSAEYRASRNGTELGRTTIELRENADATWTLRSVTIGTSGLARLAGLDVVEESTLRWRDGRLETVAYDFRQETALRNKRRHAEFDWTRREVHMTDGDSNARYALVDGTIDRHAVTLALINDLARDQPGYAYEVASKDAIETVRYTSCGEQRVSVPAGDYATRCLERVRDKRTSTSWFAQSIGWLPVRIEQVEKKGDTITLQLVALRSASQGSANAVTRGR